jgi:hypothetical protein
MSTNKKLDQLFSNLQSESNIKRIFLLEQYRITFAERAGHLELSKEFGVSSPTEYYLQKTALFLEHFKANINKNEELIALSSELNQRLSSDSKLSDEDEILLQFLLGYYELVFAPIHSLPNFDPLFWSIDLQTRKILQTKNGIKSELELINKFFSEMLIEMKTVISEHSYKPPNSPSQHRELTPNEEIEQKKLENKTIMYFDKMNKTFCALRQEVDSLSTEIEKNKENFKKLSAKSEKSTRSLFEFMKMIVEGTVCDEFKKCLEEYEELKSSFEKTKTELDSCIQRVFKFIDKIDSDIVSIRTRRNEFKDYAIQCENERTIRKQRTIREQRNSNQDDDILRKKALDLLFTSRCFDLDREKQPVFLPEYLRLVEITNQEECSNEEWRLREKIIYLSPSLGRDFPKGFPIAFPEQTCSD